MKIRQILIILLSLVILVIIGLSYSIGKKNGLKYGVANAESIRASTTKKVVQVNDSIIPKYVKSLTVKNKTYPVILHGYGKVIAAASINISTEVQGLLSTNITLKKGTKFQKGQTLFNIKSTDSKLALQSKKSSFLTGLTSILPDLAIDYPESYKNWKIFFEKINVEKPLPKLPDFKSTKEKSFIISRNILSQYYSINSDEERLKKFTITAPFSGSIIESYTDNGATISPGMAIIKVIRDGKLEIEIPVLSKNISLIKKGEEVELISSNHSIIVGKIIRIGEYVNPITQTIPVFVSIESNPENLYNGMYLESTINCNSVQKAMKIPRTAIFGDQMIYIISEDNKLKAIEVNISTYQDKTALVTGLTDGIQIVSEAVVNAKDGIVVEIIK